MMVTANKLLLVCSMFICLNAVAQTDTTEKYFTRLVNSDQPLLEKKLYALLKSDKEKDWLLAQQFFYQMKKIAVADSISAADKLKFPTGQIVRNEVVTVIYDEKNAVKKEQLYKEWIKKFPPEKFGPDRIQYDYARHAVATAYAEADSVSKALQYVAMLETGPWIGEGGASIANILLKNGHVAEAKMLIKTAVDNAMEYMTVKKNEKGAGFAAVGYPSYCNTYVQILYDEKNYPEALKYVQQAYEHSTKPKPSVYALYTKILIAMGKDQEAFDKLDESMKKGIATPELKAQLKPLYIKLKGSDAGYDAYLADVNKMLAAKFLTDLPSQMIDLPAPGFTLQDLNGHTVSLADLKGKIVVLDFWATWCGPCKASFPAMQMAVNKYKEDPDVKFLFIHTWEKQDSATQRAKKFITDAKYDFQVLMDLKDEVSHKNNVVESFKVNGIPAKFVIDKNGHIRFRLTGFEGGNDAAVEELSAMIELSKKS